MPHNRKQPGPAVATVEPLKELKGTQVRFLHDVFRVMIIPRQPTRQIVSRIYVH
jgi:hypothetical protein